MVSALWVRNYFLEDNEFYLYILKINYKHSYMIKNNKCL